MEGVMSTFNKQPDFVSIERAAEMLSVSTKTIRNWIKSGDLPAFETGPKLIRINVLDIRAFCRPARNLNWNKHHKSRSDMTSKARAAYGDSLVQEMLGAQALDE
jgi:excisionase family DNA binding protein